MGALIRGAEQSSAREAVSEVVRRSGGGGEGDLMAECLKLADEVAGLTVPVKVLVVEVRAGVVCSGGAA